jgi:diguanylate cyclase (GGDEF)-like protein/PAS domain S-box-containing protein
VERQGDPSIQAGAVSDFSGFDPVTTFESTAAVVTLVLLVLLVATGVMSLVRMRRNVAAERDTLGQALAASEAVSAALSEEALFLAAVLSGVEAVIVVADRSGRVRFVNERFGSVFGVRSAEVIGRSRDHLREKIAPCFEDPEGFRTRDAAVDERRTGDGRTTAPSFRGDEAEMVLASPTRRVLRWQVMPVERSDERIGIVAFFRDVTREREAEASRARLLEELASQARTDALTLLSNRRHASETLSAEVERARRYGRPLAVVLFDLDHFKQVNDDLGHEAGDAVLRAFGAVLRSSARGTDVVARWGGEEFLAILHEADLDAAVAFADRVRSALSSTTPLARFVGEGDPARAVTVSAGVAAMSPGEELDADALVRRADEALYDAKESGRDRVARADQVLPMPPSTRISAPVT